MAETVDYHTAGEPFRIVAHPPVVIPGATVAERRANAITDPQVDGLRQVLCFEPRGHADMYGGFITPADDAGAHFGVLFWHKDGFSTACGHGTIALGVWAIDTGLVQPNPSGRTDVVIDVPSGRVTARVHTTSDGRIEGVDFVNVPSRLVVEDVTVATSCGVCSVALAWGGALLTVFADGQVDRSPCGSGTAARVAVLHANGELQEDQTLVHDSLVGSRFHARVMAQTTDHGQPAVVPVVTGNAYRVARSAFEVDPRDPLTPGFVLR